MLNRYFRRHPDGMRIECDVSFGDWLSAGSAPASDLIVMNHLVKIIDL